MSQKKDVLRTRWQWPQVRDWGVPFTTNWVSCLMAGLDSLADEELARKVMSKPAESCARSFLDHLCKDHGYDRDSHDLDALIASLDSHIVESRYTSGVQRRGNTIDISYPPLGEETDCACPLVFNHVVELTPTHCLCSANMHRLVFEEVTRKPVEVEILEAIGRGGQKCAFRVHLAG